MESFTKQTPQFLRQENAIIRRCLDQTLWKPAEEFLSRPSKRFRGQLVTHAFTLVSGRDSLTVEEQSLCAKGAQLLEQIHAGSLVVDDIQDDSLLRRGKPTLHRLVGIPTALNTGNWMYFQPLEAIRHWGLDASTELRLYRACHFALVQAHHGQALDVGIAIDQVERSEVRSICLASLELKTGALMELASVIGAILGQGSDSEVETLGEFGKSFGIALQMLDDIGNALAKKSEDPKRFEDLKLKRPTWVWAVVSEMEDQQWDRFLSAVNDLPKTESLAAFFETGALSAAHTQAEQYLSLAITQLGESFGEVKAVKEIREMGSLLLKAYR